jgi:hypothetical protein
MNPELFHLIADQRDPISGQGKYHTWKNKVIVKMSHCKAVDSDSDI